MFERITAGETIAARRAGCGATTGFDYMRLVLAIGVLAWHSVVVSYGPGPDGQIMATSARGVITLMLPMFFALSGFLVAGSLDRNPDIANFVTLRVIRIVPALSVEIALSALILGPVLTVLSFGAYFSDHFSRPTSSTSLA